MFVPIHRKCSQSRHNPLFKGCTAPSNMELMLNKKMIPVRTFRGLVVKVLSKTTIVYTKFEPTNPGSKINFCTLDFHTFVLGFQFEFQYPSN